MISWIQRRVWISFCVALFAFANAERVDACPNCKEAISAQPADVTRMANGYNWSVMFMIAVPFTMLAQVPSPSAGPSNWECFPEM